MKLVRMQPVCLSLLLVAGAASLCACQSENVSGEAVPEKDINAVMESHVDRLMAIEGVTGVAIGATDEGEPCILVLIREESDEIVSKIPEKLEEYPVRTLVSGEIKPMQSD